MDFDTARRRAIGLAGLGVGIAAGMIANATSADADYSGPSLNGVSLSITYAQIPTLSITVLAFRTTGYATPGDAGDALYIHGSSSGPMAIQDASGQWWELARTGEWSCVSWGAKGDGSTDNTTTLNAWLAACVAYGQNAYAPPGVYMNTGIILDCTAAILGNSSAIIFYGTHMSQSIFKLISGSTNHHLTIKTGVNYGNMSMPIVREMTIHGGFYYGGHGIYCYSAWDGSNLAALGLSCILENITVVFPGLDGVFATTVTNYSGMAIDVCVAHPGRHGFNLNSSNWITTRCKVNSADMAGQSVTGAVSNGGPNLIRLTVPGHTLTTGQTTYIYNVGGVGAATGVWPVTVIDANTIDLQGSTFSGTYTSGGRCVGVWNISGVADNGSGAARITTTAAHPYVVGDQVFLRNAGGVPNVNGGWSVLAVPSPTTFDLNYGELLLGKGWTSALNGQIYTSGGTVHSFRAGMYFGPYAAGPGGCQFSQMDLWNNFMGLVVTCASTDAMQFLEGDIFNNYLEGITVQTFGGSPFHSFSGRMAVNSWISTGQFSDILVSNTGGMQFNMNHVNLGNQVKYLIENDGTVFTSIFFNPIIDLTNAHNAFAVNMSNNIDTAHFPMNVPLGIGSVIASGTGNAANRYADSGGKNNNASGQYSFVRGSTNTITAQYGAGFGQLGNDKGMLSLVWGSNIFANQGDNQTRPVITGGTTTTNATTGRITVGNTTAVTAAGTNSFNLFFDKQAAVYSSMRVVCKNPATGDTKVWSITDLVVKRVSNVITLNGSGSTITMTAVYTDSALSACAVQLIPDNTNLGINVAATGISATTLHWSLDARVQEIV